MDSYTMEWCAKMLVSTNTNLNRRKNGYHGKEEENLVDLSARKQMNYSNNWGLTKWAELITLLSKGLISSNISFQGMDPEPKGLICTVR